MGASLLSVLLSMRKLCLSGYYLYIRSKLRNDTTSPLSLVNGISGAPHSTTLPTTRVPFLLLLPHSYIPDLPFIGITVHYNLLYRLAIVCPNPI